MIALKELKNNFPRLFTTFNEDNKIRAFVENEMKKRKNLMSERFIQSLYIRA